MQRKTVIFIADSLDNAHRFQQVLSRMDVDVVAGSSLQFKKLLAAHPDRDLVIFEARDDTAASVAQAEAQLQGEGSCSMLIIVNESQLATFRLPGADQGRLRGAGLVSGRDRRPHPPIAVAGKRNIVGRLHHR